MAPKKGSAKGKRAKKEKEKHQNAQSKQSQNSSAKSTDGSGPSWNPECSDHKFYPESDGEEMGSVTGAEDPPRSCTACILYELDGQADGASNRWLTCFTDSISDCPDMRKGISKLPSKNNNSNGAAAEKYFDNMWQCKGDRVVECYFLHDSDIITERVGTNVRNWINEKYDCINKMYNSGDKSSQWLDFMEEKMDDPWYPKWWNYMQEERFKDVFRDIMKGLRHIFKLGYHCGSLLNDGVSILQEKLEDGKKLKVRTKLLEIRERKFEEGTDKVNKKIPLKKDFDKDIRDLRYLMIEALFKPYLVKHNMDVNQDFVDQIFPVLSEGLANYSTDHMIPKGLLSFVGMLCNENYIENADKQWILDDSFFWEPMQKLNFIRKLRDLMYSEHKLCSYHIDDHFRGEFGKKNWTDVWESVIEKDATVKEVHDYCEKVISKLDTEKDSISPSPSFQMTRLYRNVGEHYNQRLRDKAKREKTKFVEKKKPEISQIADDLLEQGVCTTLRRACEKFWWPLGPPNRFQDYYREQHIMHLLSDRHG